MILTGKAKEAFLKHVYFTEDTIQVNESIEAEILEESSCWLINQDERFRHAMIISWLDSVGIYVNVCPNYLDHERKYSEGDFKAVINFQDGTNTVSVDFPFESCFVSLSRQQATEKAIEKAIEIYNERGN